MQQARVYIVTADPVIRRSLRRMCTLNGYRTRTFAAGVEFLRTWIRQPPGCLILDLKLPGPDGLEILRRLRATGCRWPVIMLAAHADRAQILRAVGRSGLLFFEKPVREAELLVALVHAALALRAVVLPRPALAAERIPWALSVREEEVLQGLLNSERIKQTAARLGISESTVKSCRRTILRKLGARSTAQLIQRVTLAGGAHALRP